MYSVVYQILLPHSVSMPMARQTFKNFSNISLRLRVATCSKIFYFLDFFFPFFSLLSSFFYRITAKFLINILTEENLEKVEQIVIIRLWLKCSMLSTSPNEVFAIEDLPIISFANICYMIFSLIHLGYSSIDQNCSKIVRFPIDVPNH